MKKMKLCTIHYLITLTEEHYKGESAEELYHQGIIALIIEEALLKKGDREEILSLFEEELMEEYNITNKTLETNKLVYDKFRYRKYHYSPNSRDTGLSLKLDWDIISQRDIENCLLEIYPENKDNDFDMLKIL